MGPQLVGEVVTEIVWEEPPQDIRGRTSHTDHAAIAEELRLHPGQWAKILIGRPSLAGEIKAGRYRAFEPKGSFEAVSRKVRDVDGRRVADIYVRYIGDGST